MPWWKAVLPYHKVLTTVSPPDSVRGFLYSNTLCGPPSHELPFAAVKNTHPPSEAQANDVPRGTVMPKTIKSHVSVKFMPEGKTMLDRTLTYC